MSINIPPVPGPLLLTYPLTEAPSEENLNEFLDKIKDIFGDEAELEEEWGGSNQNSFASNESSVDLNAVGWSIILDTESTHGATSSGIVWDGSKLLVEIAPETYQSVGDNGIDELKSLIQTYLLPQPVLHGGRYRKSRRKGHKSRKTRRGHKSRKSRRVRKTRRRN